MEQVAARNHQIPEANLRLIRGCKLRLLRNFHPSEGLCNGTLLIVRKIGRHFLEVQIISEGEFYGKIAVLFRFKFDIETKSAAFSRLQFPIASAFAGTVHRFQGQTVHTRGRLLLDQRRNPFCHGQSYVAFSRAQRADQVMVITQPDVERTLCLVYQELTKEGTDFDELHTQISGDTHDNHDDTEDWTVPAGDPITVTAENWNGLTCVGNAEYDIDDFDEQ